jgi:hypothetical protein
VYAGIAVVVVGIATFAIVTLRRFRPEAAAAAEAV